MFHVTDSLDLKRLDTESLDTERRGLPRARMPVLLRHFYRWARKLLRSIIARIDLSQFPGSCCG
ncbi:hypothetical protein JJE66_37150 [Bradyrhizobium diazoefficiens]|uniref:hypothetical protein n=1 Tax=Bradyrhizobium diazoefficiens TaxID=1355477 RepID=UPI00190B3F84|nr:hypothetical protein [Bradyrhizobium diazoefficiens]MBK3666823.1 hypothetical protein [Bradyrhizobium diazoefficiens]